LSGVIFTLGRFGGIDIWFNNLVLQQQPKKETLVKNTQVISNEEGSFFDFRSTLG